MIVPDKAIQAMQTVVLGDGDVTNGHVPSVEDCRAVIEAVAPCLELEAQARIDKVLELIRKKSSWCSLPAADALAEIHSILAGERE